MVTLRKTALLAAFAASFGILSAPTEARAWTGLEGPPYPVWGLLPVKYYVNEATFPPEIASTAKQRLVDGFGVWSTPECTDFSTELLGDLPDGTWNANDNKNVLMWVNKPDPWPSDLGPVDAVIGVTLPVWSQDGEGNQIIYDADIVFNNVGFCWYDSAVNPGGNCSGGSPVDTLSIAAHEQGHFLGLGHTNAPGSTMLPNYPGGNEMATIEQDDVDGVCNLYPPGSGVPSCGACTTNAAKTECNALAQGCNGACVGLYNCEAQCPTGSAAEYDSCLTACKDQYPAGVETYEAYTNCICNLCANSCPIECAGSAGAGVGGGGATGAWNEEDPEGPQIEDSGGCGCAVEGKRGKLGAFIALGLALAALGRRRRRR
ncbi:matrixin family metalloprotease [Polyangium spumosum]|uniref:Matrixin family metalloprotease n=1 Tax=Polyangium spumosum TaxID=889282 RepID=A0A6N7PLU9_9BACT|nr:matrixin family metalloprotease [Polyangium spumosum]MRG91230.1 matrixin family metalloprotease [Polyangium spumosum]